MTILSSPEGRNLSLRHVSLSTCGLCDRIDELAELGLGLTLSISLHAADDETRSGIMPVNKQYNIARLMQSCKITLPRPAVASATNMPSSPG